MNELIKITERNGEKAVSARELHVFLESKREFATWIKDRIKKYDLVENRDYTSFDEIVKRETGATTLTQYALSIPCAKELAMVEGNAKGKQARQYFIACEEKLKEVVKPLSPAEQLLRQAQLAVEHEERINAIEERVGVIESKTRVNPTHFTIIGYATLHNISVNLKQASSVGKKASILCRQRNFQTGDCPDPRFGRVKTYPSEILDEVFEMPIN